MRKVFLGALAAVIVLSADAGTTFAAGAGSGRYFVDADRDGVCDNAGSMCTYVDADGDGVCDVCVTNYAGCLNGDGTAFVDADGDGVCDNYAAGRSRGNGQGRGNGRGSQGGRGRCGR